MRVDGGATANDLLMQFQSDILNVPVVRPKIYETTALGAAYLAGVAVNYWENLDTIREQWQADKKFVPAMEHGQRTQLLNGWQRAIRSSIAWADGK